MAQFRTQWPVGGGEMAACIRALDWAATPLGAIAGWSDRLKVMVEQVLASPVVSSLVCGPERVLIYNDAAAKLYGDRHPAALGHPLPETFPEGWATVASYYDRAFLGEAVQVKGQPLDTRGEGVQSDIFDALLVPVHDADGRVACVHMTGFEIGGRLRAEAALRASKAQYRQLFDAIDEGFCIVEVLFDAAGQAHDYRFLMVNAAFEPQTGLPNAVGRRMRELAPSHEAHWFETYGRIALTGQPKRFEHRAEALGRWYDVYAFRTGSPEQRHVGILFKDVLARKRAEVALRESEERQAFLLSLGDAMRAQSNVNAIIEVAARLLGERMNASRIMFAEFDHERGIADIFFGWFADGAKPFPAVMRLEDYEGPILDDLRAGRIVRVEDTSDPALKRPDFAAIAEHGVAALLSMPLLIAGKLLVNLSVHQHAARCWTDNDVELVKEVAERLWADLVRARAEAALVAAEAWQRVLIEGIPQLVWRAVDSGHWTWASPQWTSHTGQSEPESRGWGWLEPVHPEDRDAARAAWESAFAAGSFAADFRIYHVSDKRYRWFQTRAKPVRDEDGTIVEWLGTTTDVDDLRTLQARQEVLVNELQHRSRNLLGVVTSVANRTVGRGSPAESFLIRLKALSRAQALLSQSGSDTVAVEAMVRAELNAHAGNAPDRIIIDGPAVTLTSQQVQNFTLALHELSTNAVKYGALKNGTGHLSVTWEVTHIAARRHLALKWVETGVDVQPENVTRRGYGRELIERALAYALGGRTEYVLDVGGVRCRIELPLM